MRGMATRPYIFTKCGLAWDESGKITRTTRAGSIRRECEASLRRLKVEAIDLYQVHWPVDDEIEEAWEMMEQLRSEGKVRNIGVSNFNVSQLRRCLKIAPVSSLQPPYSIINRDYEKEVLPYCKVQGIGVIVYSPMGSGLLTGAMTRERIEAMPADDWRRNHRNFNEPALSRNLEIAATLKSIGEKHGRTAGEAAIAWTLRNPAVTAAIVGGRSTAQVDGIKRAWDLQLTGEDLLEIERYRDK